MDSTSIITDVIYKYIMYGEKLQRYCTGTCTMAIYVTVICITSYLLFILHAPH